MLGSGSGIASVFCLRALPSEMTAVMICMSMLVQADRAKAQIKALAVLIFYAFSVNGAPIGTEAAQLQVLQRLRYSLSRQPLRAGHMAPEETFLHSTTRLSSSVLDQRPCASDQGQSPSQRGATSIALLAAGSTAAGGDCTDRPGGAESSAEVAVVSWQQP